MIAIILSILAIYLVLGIALDILLHVNTPVIYWSPYEALIGHLSTIAVWPLALHIYLTDRE